MIKTAAALFAVTNGVMIREQRDDVFAQIEEQRDDVFAQTSTAAWRTIQGMCTDADGQQYDYFETNGIRAGWGRGGMIT
jgi:hypothetical protein